jgi:protein-S-isoprenylcysteine O-methyltransferase Ste14
VFVLTAVMTAPGTRTRWRLPVAISLGLRNLLFMVLVPASGAVYGPWWILMRDHSSPRPVAWPAAALILIGIALYLWCVWVFAVVGRGTPAPWDAPRHFVAVGPYRWARNPIYIAALLVIGGEAWLFLSLQLLLYAAAVALGVHLFVVGFEEPTLRRQFGERYEAYRRSVSRWIPHVPRAAGEI